MRFHQGRPEIFLSSPHYQQGDVAKGVDFPNSRGDRATDLCMLVEGLKCTGKVDADRWSRE